MIDMYRTHLAQERIGAKNMRKRIIKAIKKMDNDIYASTVVRDRVSKDAAIAVIKKLPLIEGMDDDD